MKHQKSFYFSVVSVFIFQVLASSCAFTWTGYKIGKEIDKGNFKEGPGSRIAKVTPENLGWGGNNLVEIHKTDSTVVTGCFMKYDYQASMEYQPRYNRFKDSVALLTDFPPLKTELTITMNYYPGSIYSGLFEGFTSQGILFSMNGKQRSFYTSNAVKLEDSASKAYDINAINQVVESRLVPCRSIVCIKPENDGPYQIPLDQIAYARSQRNDNQGKIIGLLLGGTVDIILTAVIWSAIRRNIQQH